MKYVKFLVWYMLGPLAAGGVVGVAIGLVQAGVEVEPVICLVSILSFVTGYVDSRFTLGLIDRFK